MTLDASRETETKDGPTCRFCGGKFDLGYRYMCHTCGATYCYIHMGKHARAHSPRNYEGKPLAPLEVISPAGASGGVILTSDPAEIELIRTYMQRLLQGDDPLDRVQSLEGHGG